MTRYEFHCNNQVLELTRETGSVFIDLKDVDRVLDAFVAGEDVDAEGGLPVHVEPDDVYHLFGYYGFADRCPVGQFDCLHSSVNSNGICKVCSVRVSGSV